VFAQARIGLPPHFVALFTNVRQRRFGLQAQQQSETGIRICVHGEHRALISFDQRANNQARQVQVSVGVGQGDRIEVLGDVSPGDLVVIRGNERLQPGQAVSVMDG